MCYSIGAFIGESHPDFVKVRLLTPARLNKGPIMAGQLIQGLEIRNGWIVMCCLSSLLSIFVLPSVVLYLGGPLKSRRRKEPDEPARSAS